MFDKWVESTMCWNNKILEVYDDYTISFSAEIECKPEDAITWLEKKQKELFDKSPNYNNEVKINPRISLRMPGKYSLKHPGDYCLICDGIAPTHSQVCDALIVLIDNEEKYKRWVNILEDVYYNGTINLGNYNDEKEHFVVQFLFWITLQEDINKPDMFGRLIPFCRYAEAIATTQKTVSFTIEDVRKRIECTDPKVLEPLILPIEPKFYKWSAF